MYAVYSCFMKDKKMFQTLEVACLASIRAWPKVVCLQLPICSFVLLCLHETDFKP